MKSPLLVAYAPCFLSRACHADPEIKWGKPVNGIRVGVECTMAEIPANKQPTFKVTIQNVSGHEMSIPPASALVHKQKSIFQYFYESALVPIVDLNRADTPDRYEFPLYGTVRPDPPTDMQVPAPVVIAPQGSVTWDNMPLQAQYCNDERPSSLDKATIQGAMPCRAGIYRFGFRFENRQATFGGKTVWTGQADSGLVGQRVDAAGTEGIKLDGGFSLPKLTYFVGEPIEATFTMTNRGDESLGFTWAFISHSRYIE